MNITMILIDEDSGERVEYEIPKKHFSMALKHDLEEIKYIGDLLPRETYSRGMHVELTAYIPNKSAV